MHSPALLQPPHTHHPAAPPTWPQLGAWRPPAGGVAAAAAGSWCVAAGVGGVGTRPGLAAATARARLPPCSASTDLQHAAAAQSTTINTTQHNTETHNSRQHWAEARCLEPVRWPAASLVRCHQARTAQPRVATLQIMPLLLPCLLSVSSCVPSHPSALSPQLPIAYSVTVTETTLLSSFKTSFKNILSKTHSNSVNFKSVEHSDKKQTE